MTDQWGIKLLVSETVGILQINHNFKQSSDGKLPRVITESLAILSATQKFCAIDH